VYALGSGETGHGWRVGVRDPREDTEREAAVLCLSNSALSTSGSYESFFEIAGRRHGHIVDPRSGRPAEPMLSATVISPDATESDALSTAVYVLGTDEGQKLLDGLGLGGLLIARKDGGEPLAVRETGGVRVGECEGAGGVGDGR
jgi:thiamine biosynthesis lipoprotein